MLSPQLQLRRRWMSLSEKFDETNPEALLRLFEADDRHRKGKASD